jgi:hypothetical protein
MNRKNRKEDRLLTPALSSFEEERERRGARLFRGSRNIISENPLPKGEVRGKKPG